MTVAYPPLSPSEAHPRGFQQIAKERGPACERAPRLASYYTSVSQHETLDKGINLKRLSRAERPEDPFSVWRTRGFVMAKIELEDIVLLVAPPIQKL